MTPADAASATPAGAASATPTPADALDDLDARPGSATSVLRTMIGATLRAQGGWLPSAAFVEALATVGVSAERTRTTLSRVKTKGLLTAEARDGRPGYRLTPGAERMLARGDRRIYTPLAPHEPDAAWCLISFSIPEEQRDVRHRLRRALTWIGAGTVSPALWIVPAHATAEVEEIVAGLGLADRVTLFRVDELRSLVHDPRALAAQWWDLAALRARHDAFLTAHSGDLATLADDPSPRTAFAVWTRALDDWRPIPSLDPGLPAALAPTDWPGPASAALFLALRATAEARAQAFVAELATA